jgi:catechol 2,3-dioxygenase-like lactoylglutathione lyase family enzyme
MPVLGIGGLFFRARDPAALTAWYRDHLNVGPGCTTTPGAEVDKWSWQTEGGPVVFMPFSETTDHWDASKQSMLNLRVCEIDVLLEALRAAGVEVITKPEWDDPHTGRFARIHDPEGNAIELWQPPTD